MQKKLLACIFALVLLFPTQAFANDEYTDLKLPAGKVDLSTLPVDFQKILSRRTDEINNYFDKLQELNFKVELAEKEVERQERFGAVTMSTLLKFNEANNALNYYDNNSLAIVGLEKIASVDEEALLQPYSNKSQASIQPPIVYYDNDSKSYVASANWNWNTKNPDINNRGRDGVGVSIVQEKISLFDTHLKTWDSKGALYWPKLTTKVTSYGYHQTFEDNSNGATYTAHKGTSWMFFRFYNAKPVGKLVNFNSRYDHTWSGVNITGVSIGSSSIGVTFSSGNNWSTTNYSGVRF